MKFLLSTVATVASSPLARAVGTPQETRSFQQFPEELPEVIPQMFYPDFWVRKCPDARQVIMDQNQLQRYHQRAFKEEPTLVDLTAFPRQLPEVMVRQAIGKLSVKPRAQRFQRNGTPLTCQDYQRLKKAMALDTIPKTVKVRWAIAVRRSCLRTFPTAETVTAKDKNSELDRFQETGINTGELLAVLHESADRQWLFVQRYNYRGWAPVEDLALATRRQAMRYVREQPRLVITGAKVQTALSPNQPQISQVSLDMGDSLPLAKKAPDHLDQMGLHGNWVILLPTRAPQGRLSLQPALISRSSDVNLGYLPLTRANLIRQAFKFQGERYGWGDANGTRDCTGFLISVFRSCGLLLPRNSNRHMETLGKTIRLTKLHGHVDPRILDTLKPGDAFESPVHAMLYLGKAGQEHFVIHDTLGVTVPQPNGSFKNIPLRQVAVTPLTALKYSNGKSIADNFELVRRFILPELED